MTSTANTSTSTGNPLKANQRNGQRTNYTPPVDNHYRLNPYADITQGVSQFSIMNQDTSQLDKHTNKFHEPYKKEVPSTDSLSTMAREILSNSNQPKHLFDGIHKPKSITPPLPTPHANTKRPPSSTNFTHHLAKETSPIKPNLRIAESNIKKNRNVNLEIYDLQKIFDEMTQIKPLIKRFSDDSSKKPANQSLLNDKNQKENFSNGKLTSNSNSIRLNERKFQLTDDEEDDQSSCCIAKPRMKAKSKGEKNGTKPDPSKAINDGNDTESELENERSSTMNNIKPIENNLAPVKNPSSSDESSSSSSSSSSDDDSSSSSSTSSDEDDDSSSSSSSSSSSDEESSTSSGDSKKTKSLNPITTDINMNNPPLIKLPKLISSQTIFPIKQLARQPVQRTTPEAKLVFEPKPLLNPTPPPQQPSVAQREQPAANDENDSNIEPHEAQEKQEQNEEEEEEEVQEDANNITIEEIIVNINSPNKKASSKTTSPILPSTPDSKHELKMEQTAKSSSQSSSITFTLSDDEISDDSNASNQNVKNLYSFSSGFSAIKPSQPNSVSNRSSDESGNKSDLNNNNNNSLNLSSNLDASNLDDTLLNDSKTIPFSGEQPKASLKLEPNKASTPSPIHSLNQPLSAGFVPSLTDGANRPLSFMDLIENANKTESKNETIGQNATEKETKDENDEEVKNIFSPEERKKRSLGQNSINTHSTDTKQDKNSKKIKNDNSFIDKPSDLLNKFDLEKKDSINLLKKIANGDLARLGPCSPLTNQIVNQMNLDESGLINGTTSSNVADQIQYSADGRPKLIVSIELDLIKLLNMNLAPPDAPVVESCGENDKKNEDKVRHNKQKEMPRERSRDRSRDKDMSPKRSSSHYKDYKRSSVSSSSSRGSDYRDKSSRDRDTKSSRSDSKSKSTSSKNKSDSDSKEYRKDNSSYKSTSNSQSVKRSSILNEDQDLTNTSKKQKLSAEQTLSNSVKSAAKVQNVNKSPNLDKQARDSDSKASLQNKQTNAKGNAETKISNGMASKSSKIEKTSKISKTFDFLNTALEEQVLHQRGKQKKHEADNEKDKLKKPISYMEAVCYFSLCAIAQYRLKKTSAASSTSNKSSFDLLKDTYELLRFLIEKLVKPIDNEIFIKKFRVLSNWMEAFINRWLWLMSLKELNLIRESLKDHYSKQAMAQLSQTNPLNHQHHSNSGSKTSPNEIPPPSPASSVGSSAGSSNSNNAMQNSQSTQQSQSQESSSNSNSQPQQIGLSAQKLMAYSERYFKLTEYNMRSQNFWDVNEHQINDEKHLSDFRETIKQQIERDLHIDSQVELFAAYILTGLELFKLNNF